MCGECGQMGTADGDIMLGVELGVTGNSQHLWWRIEHCHRFRLPTVPDRQHEQPGKQAQAGPRYGPR